LTTRLHAEFPHALRDGQVIGYFQPEIELSSGRLVAVELLARWEHPELGTLPPALFTTLAEQLGLMPEFTHLMLRQALAQHRAWADAGWEVPVSVNIGPAAWPIRHSPPPSRTCCARCRCPAGCSCSR